MKYNRDKNMPTVLVVDDDLKLLKMLQRTLMYENLHVLYRDQWTGGAACCAHSAP